MSGGSYRARTCLVKREGIPSPFDTTSMAVIKYNLIKSDTLFFTRILDEHGI